MACIVPECKKPSYVECGWNPDKNNERVVQCLDHAQENLKEQCFDIIYYKQLTGADNPSYDKSLRKYMDNYIVGLKESKLYPSGERK